MNIEEDSAGSKKAWQSRDRGSGAQDDGGNGNIVADWNDQVHQQALVSAMNEPDVDSTFASLKNSGIPALSDPNSLRQMAQGYINLGNDPSDPEYGEINERMAYALNALADEGDGGFSNEQPDSMYNPNDKSFTPIDDESYSKYTMTETVKDNSLDSIIKRYK